LGSYAVERVKLSAPSRVRRRGRRLTTSAGLISSVRPKTVRFPRAFPTRLVTITPRMVPLASRRKDEGVAVVDFHRQPSHVYGSWLERPVEVQIEEPRDDRVSPGCRREVALVLHSGFLAREDLRDGPQVDGMGAAQSPPLHVELLQVALRAPVPE
jgi:hypothetical protein